MAKRVLIAVNNIQGLVLVKTRDEGAAIYQRHGVRYPQNVVSIIYGDNDAGKAGNRSIGNR